MHIPKYNRISVVLNAQYKKINFHVAVRKVRNTLYTPQIN
ncbi:hypothetical protein LSO2F_70052 [Candidatus Liberibacter solanacearum]